MINKLKEIKPGEIFSFGGYKWVKLEQEGLYLMEGFLESIAFDNSSNNWRNSQLREYLNIFFYKLMFSVSNTDDFLSYEIDLTSDDGMRDYGKCENNIGLLTADLYRSNRHLLKPLKDWWWLATPKTCIKKYNDECLIVNDEGLIDSVCVYEDYLNVRPVICLQPDTLVVVPETEDNSGGKEDITELIKKWAVDRDITSGNPKAQMVKLMEEVGELANGINKDKKEQTIDSIGDIYVVLVILCMQLGLDINDCIKAAFEEIKNRKGKMVNGLFVKEEDLEG